MAIDVLVCNLTRFGDLLQCQPLLGDLHAGGYKTGLICLEQFQGACSLLRHLSGVWPLPAASFIASSDKSWMLAAGKVLEYVNKVLAEAQPRYILNLTPSVAARVLARLLAKDGAQMEGFGLDDDGYGLNTNAWSSFLAVSASRRANSPFNVADILRNSALRLSGGRRGSHFLAAPDREAREWAARQHKFLMKLHKAKGLVAFQPGSSEARRRWPIEYFARLGGILWEKARLLPVLTGTKPEMELGIKYHKFSDKPFANAIGSTSLQQLAALLKTCKLLVTNDTGTMHLAAGENVPSLSLFSASAQAWDTAPLLPNSCCLEPAIDCHPCAYDKRCDTYECARAIKPEAVADIILHWLETGQWQPAGQGDNSYRMWVTGKDATGLTIISPCGSTGQEDRSRWMAILHDFWSQTLDELDLPGKKQPRDNTGLPLPGKLDQKLIPSLRQTAELIASMEDLGVLLGKSPQAGNLLLKNSSRLQLILDDCPPLSTLALFWRELCAAQQKDASGFLELAGQFGKACAGLAERLTFLQNAEISNREGQISGK